MTFNSNIKIGNVKLKSCIILAPMAGITDIVLRKLIREYSQNSLLTTEMISSEGLMQNHSGLIIETTPDEMPISFQISGHKPELMAKSAKLLENRANIIDINMGCPINKIVKGSDGASLMKNPDLAYDIVQAVKDSVKIPVTCKFRLGWSEDNKNFIEFAQKMQSAGASAITIHCRTKTQLYSGYADWKILSQLYKQIDIPYFANGDIVCPKTAKDCLEISKANGIAIGRAIMGEPSLIYRIEEYIYNNNLINEPNLSEKIEMLKKHIQGEIKFRGEINGIKFVRKFYPQYIKNIRNGSIYRHQLVTELSYKKITDILKGIVDVEQQK